MIRGALLFAVLTAAPIGTVTAEDAKPSASGKPAERKICRREAKTGSIMSRPVCRTQAEWDQLTANGRNDLDRARDMDRSRSAVGGLRQN